MLRFLQQKPDLKAALESVAGREEEARAALKKLRPQTPQERAGRLALALYYETTTRPDKAKAEVVALRRDYPTAVEVLRAEVALLLLPAPGTRAPAEPPAEAVAAGDKLIRQFLADNPREAGGKLFWAEWLAQTKRADKAVEYLQDPANFPGARDELHQRVLAVALLRKGDREASARVLQHLPHDPATDALLIRALAAPDEREKKLGEAVARYENQGLFRCWEAELLLGKGKAREAADAFLRAVELTQVKPLARAGLLRALFTLSEEDPRKAREAALKMLADRPEEPAPALGVAYASMLLGEVGAPGDAWAPDRPTTASALAQWERLLLRDRGEAVLGPLTAAEMWLLANRPDLARGEVVRALKEQPRSLPAAVAGVRVALASYDEELIAEGRRCLGILKEAQPDAPRTAQMEAALLEREGRVADAVTVCERLLEKKPKEGAVYAQLSGLLARQGDKEKGLTVARRWREQLPEDVGAECAEVRLLAATGKTDEARRAAERCRDAAVRRAEDRVAKRKAPEPADKAEWEKKGRDEVAAARGAVELALARALAAGKDFEAAAAWAKRLLARDRYAACPPGAWQLLGDVCLERQEWAKARDHYTAALDEDRKNFVVANNLAWLLAVKLNDAPAALEIVNEVRKGAYGGKPITGDRLNPEFLDTVGLIYRNLGDKAHYPEMRALFEAARTRYPYDPRVSLYLGDAYAGVGRPDRAAQMYADAIAQAAPKARFPLSAEERKEVVRLAEEGQKKLPARPK
jgi:tetratricopeptide (TPR) repeat protein